MKQLVILPSWLLYKATKKMLIKKGHPWYGKDISITNWADHATLLLIDISMGLWVGIILLITALRVLI